jgi:hypothetical protein
MSGTTLPRKRTPRRPPGATAENAHELRANVGWGLRGGLLVAAVFSGWAAVVYVISSGGSFEERGISLPEIVSAYAAAGVAAGLLVGMLRPLTRTRAGAYFVGYLAGCIVFVALLWAVAGPPTTWNAVHWLGILFVSCFAAYGIGGELAKSGPRGRRTSR